MTTLKYKKLRANAMTPRRAHVDDAGLDLAPTEHCNLEPGRTVKLGTGIALEIPTGHVGLLVSRSSTKSRGLDITSVIDAGYRGEVFISVTNTSDRWEEIEREAYLAQLLILPCATPGLELVTELSPSERADKGFGSSGAM